MKNLIKNLIKIKEAKTIEKNLEKIIAIKQRAAIIAPKNDMFYIVEHNLLTNQTKHDENNLRQFDVDDLHHFERSPDGKRPRIYEFTHEEVRIYMNNLAKKYGVIINNEINAVIVHDGRAYYCVMK